MHCNRTARLDVMVECPKHSNRWKVQASTNYQRNPRYHRTRRILYDMWKTTPYSRVLLEKLIVVQLFKKFPDFY